MPAITFNANDVKPSTGFEPIPPGKYKAVIQASENKPTKAGTGSYLQLTFAIVDGEYENRKLWARLNLDNPNAQAVDIARGELSAICRAVNVMEPRDTEQLHDIPLVIKVAHEKDKSDPTAEPRNVIKGYEAVTSAAPKVTPATSGPANKAPWKK